MTLFMLLLAMTGRTPVFMWLLAMLCDTTMVSIFMLTRHP
jgi:hypothetical protein